MATSQLPANTVYTAAETGNSEKLKEIITGADFNIEELNKWDATSGLTPLMIASEKGHLECVNLLFKHPKIEINKGNSKEQFTALYCASIYGNVDVVRLLCSTPNITDSIINRKFYINFHLHLCTFKTPILEIHFLRIFTGFILWNILIFPIISTFYDVLIIPYWNAFYSVSYIFFQIIVF
jgi:hypothetical protein